MPELLIELRPQQQCNICITSSDGNVYSGLIPSRVKLNTLKLLLTASLLDAQRQWWRTSRQFFLLFLWERQFVGFPHLGVVDRWLATSKQLVITLWSLSRDKRINIKNTNLYYTRGITPKHEKKGEIHLRGIAPGQHRYTTTDGHANWPPRQLTAKNA